MTRRLRFAFMVAFLAAVTAGALSAMAFTGRDASAVRPAASLKARAPAALAEQVRVDRRDSFSRTGCSKRARPVHVPDV
jgi:hypothetical protein